MPNQGSVSLQERTDFRRRVKREEKRNQNMSKEISFTIPLPDYGAHFNSLTIYPFLSEECNNQNFEDVRSVVDTGLSLSAAHRPSDKVGRCPWLVSRTICTTHLHLRSASWSRILYRALFVPGNSLGEKTDSSCPQKAYNLVRKKKKTPPERMP